jgi:uncharacterized protein (TIRG00374 family)
VASESKHAAVAPSRQSFLARHKRILGTILAGAAMLGFAYYVVPQIVGLGPSLRRLRSGNPWWLALGVPLEAASLAAYIVLFRGVFSRQAPRIGWRASTQITMAGGAATKLLAAAGSGGIAVTVWALRAAGITPSAVADGMVSFEILNYGVYMAALVVFGLGLWSGLLEGPAPIGLTLIPALLGFAVIAVVLAMKWLAAPTERLLRAGERRSSGRVARVWARAATVPRALHDGVGSAVLIVRGKDRSWLGAIPAWGFDIATLWASFQAFGHAPPLAVLVMGYYLGTLGNALPLPAGIGGVEGGMIGAFVGLGVDGGLTVVAVLGYRTISYWLPSIPEAVGYVRLRGTVRGWRKQVGGAPTGDVS